MRCTWQSYSPGGTFSYSSNVCSIQSVFHVARNISLFATNGARTCGVSTGAWSDDSNDKLRVPACDLDLDLDLDLGLDPQGHGTPLGAMPHLSHQSQGAPRQQILGPSPTRHLDLDLDPQGHGTPLRAMAHLRHQFQQTPQSANSKPSSVQVMVHLTQQILDPFRSRSRCIRLSKF